VNNGAALRQWAHGLITAFADAMGARLAAVRRKPHSAKRVHAARKSMARLEAALADLAGIAADAQEMHTRVHALRRRAGKVRDADVLCKRLDDYDASAGDVECRQIEVLRRALHRRRKRAVRKFLRAARKSPSHFKIAKETSGAPRPIPLTNSTNIGDANREIIRIRFAELLEAGPALDGENSEALHALRLAAKRLRYALQRVEGEQLELSRMGALDQLAKALGAAHDSVVLAKRAAECDAPLVAERSRRDRREQIANARRVWANLMQVAV